MSVSEIDARKQLAEEPIMSDTTNETRAMGTVALAAGLGVALVLSAAALITATSSASSGAVETPVLAAASEAASDAPSEVEVQLTDMAISPGDLEIAPGGTLQVHNDGAAPHDVVVEGTDLATPMLQSGESAALDLGELPPGTYTLYCSVPGHRAAGMEATLVVGGGDAPAEDAAATDAHDPDAHAASAGAAVADESAVFDPNAAPEDGFTARDPRLAPAPEGTVHEVELRVSQLQGEVAPGVRQELWTFNDLVPGPVLRGKVGDVFRITLINDGQMPHSLDFHASKVAPDVMMRPVDPGEQLVYEFEAKHAGVWMYHCGVAPVLHHTGNGQYGVMIIDPPDLPEVDHEFVFVQSEFYLGPDGQPGDYEKMLDEDFDIVAFNGYANQYVHDPITDVATGERVRLWLLNAGPSENSAFHIIGTIFDTVYKEGSYRLTPERDAPGGAQALDLQPSQGGFVEFTFDEDGVYTFVTHKFANVPRGAVGVFNVGDVDAQMSH